MGEPVPVADLVGLPAAVQVAVKVAAAPPLLDGVKLTIALPGPNATEFNVGAPGAQTDVVKLMSLPLFGPTLLSAATRK